MLNALKWLVKFLETRFPEKVVPVSKDDFNMFAQTIVERVESFGADKMKLEIEALKKQIEVLNLRVGLSRPMQTVLRNKSNG